MFNVGGGEILVVLLLALLVLGPDKLPDTARKAGRYLNELRRMTSGFQEEFRQAMDVGGTDDASPTSSADDALHRTSSGPRLLAAPEVPTVPSQPVDVEAEAGSEGSPLDAGPRAGSTATGAPTAETAASPPSPPPSPSTSATPSAAGAPAGETGPELITPNRPPVAPDDGAGASSAA